MTVIKKVKAKEEERANLGGGFVCTWLHHPWLSLNFGKRFARLTVCILHIEKLTLIFPFHFPPFAFSFSSSWQVYSFIFVSSFCFRK